MSLTWSELPGTWEELESTWAGLQGASEGEPVDFWLPSTAFSEMQENTGSSSPASYLPSSGVVLNTGSSSTEQNSSESSLEE